MKGVSPLSWVSWISELSNAMGAAKPDKACGPDGVPLRAVRAAGDGGLRVLAQIAERATSQEVPEAWKAADMAAIPKKHGKGMNPGNVRGVVLSSVPGKLVVRVCR